jgi:hypothetical protein
MKEDDISQYAACIAPANITQADIFGILWIGFRDLLFSCAEDAKDSPLIIYL